MVWAALEVDATGVVRHTMASRDAIFRMAAVGWGGEGEAELVRAGKQGQRHGWPG